jgi:hypothetical protein
MLTDDLVKYVCDALADVVEQWDCNLHGKCGTCGTKCGPVTACDCERPEWVKLTPQEVAAGFRKVGEIVVEAVDAN